MATVQKGTELKEKAPDLPAVEAPTAGDVAHVPNRRPLLFSVLGLLGLAAAIFIVRYVMWASNHASTDDATVAADIIQIAPQVTGTVMKVYVDDNQHVKKGDLLAELDKASFETAYLQAKANLDLALAAAQGASSNVDLTQVSGTAQVLQASGIVGQSARGIENSKANLAKARAGVSQAVAQDSGATAAIYGARANVAIALANKQKSLDAVAGAQAQLETALAAARTAQANLDAALATADNATKQATRNDTLFSQGAISGQVADQTRAAADVARAEVRAAREQLAQAQSVVAQRRSDLRAAQNQLPAADASVSQARAQLTAAQQAEHATQDAVRETQADVAAAQAAVSQARQRQKQAAGQLAQANTVPIQVAVSRSAQSQAEAKVELAKAALRDAEINLSRTKIYAPTDGEVSKKTVEVGDLVQPGGTLMSIVPDEDVWVVANFKETQLQNVRAGEPADVEVDAFPGRVFKAHVGSISAGTGSTFALLPADNATGNFTKVVQRVPIKIILEHGQPGMELLRAGMSVVATITTSEPKQ